MEAPSAHGRDSIDDLATVTEAGAFPPLGEAPADSSPADLGRAGKRRVCLARRGRHQGTRMKSGKDCFLRDPEIFICLRASRIVRRWEASSPSVCSSR
jgi:hypothetical protein